MQGGRPSSNRPYEYILGKEAAEMLYELAQRYPEKKVSQVLAACVKSAWMQLKKSEGK